MLASEVTRLFVSVVIEEAFVAMLVFAFVMFVPFVAIPVVLVPTVAVSDVVSVAF